jgi:hypothetical protein
LHGFREVITPTEGSDSIHKLKIAVTSVAAIALIAHVLFPVLSIDAVSLGLIALGILPWLAPLEHFLEHGEVKPLLSWIGTGQFPRETI